MIRPLRRSVSFALLALACACASARTAEFAQPAPDLGFGALIDQISEPGGFFPSDNLVSNETSYLHVLGKLKQLGVTGGAYVGVGPDQNFTYIAQVKPELAFIIDIRRDAMLQHLLYKALFENARNRVEYLSLLVGKQTPKDLTKWNNATIEEIVNHVDAAEPDTQAFDATTALVHATVEGLGLTLAEQDYATVRQIHDAFRERGLDIQYSWGSRYPTFRQLLLETDLDGNRRNYLASEESFRFVKELQRRNRIIPVVGDLSGPQALAAVGREIARRGLHISAFYVSNVEQYLMRGSAFQEFSQTVMGLPWNEHSVIIRSYFGRWGGHPNSVAGHMSTQLLERFEDFVAETKAGGYRSYTDLVTKNVLPPRD
jgi:hypothetical protein